MNYLSMKYNFEIKEVSKEVALDMIQKYHYSNTLPRLNKYFLGVHLDGQLVGVVTLGYGTRPLHTIQALFKDAKTDFSKDFNKDELIKMIKKAGGDEV